MELVEGADLDTQAAVYRLLEVRNGPGQIGVFMRALGYAYRSCCQSASQGQGRRSSGCRP